MTLCLPTRLGISVNLWLQQNMPTWDDLKHKTNLKKHELDFVECEAVFDGPVVAWDDDSETYGDLRINLLGWLRGTVVQ